MKINIEHIKKIAFDAGRETLKFYGRKYAISCHKAGGSPLTEADLASNKIVIHGLKKYGLPILSEESRDNKKRLESKYVWIVDPLDGTSDFIDKTDEFSVCIGLIQKGEPVLGVIYEPALNRMSFAQKNRGAFLEKNGKKIKLEVFKETNFDKMTMLISRHHLMPAEIGLFDKLKIGKKITRGSVAKIAVIAEGKAHIYINSSNKSSEWDTAAGAVIIREAGGRITDLNGKDLTYNHKNPRHLKGYFVSNGTRHDEIIEALKNL